MNGDDFTFIPNSGDNVPSAVVFLETYIKERSPDHVVRTQGVDLRNIVSFYSDLIHTLIEAKNEIEQEEQKITEENRKKAEQNRQREQEWEELERKAEQQSV